MKLYIYHKNLRVLNSYTITKEKDLNWWMGVGGTLITEGLKNGLSLPQQIRAYKYLIRNTQQIKIYQINQQHRDLYCASVIAMVKLGLYNFDSPTDPIWISPKRKIKKQN